MRSRFAFVRVAGTATRRPTCTSVQRVPRPAEPPSGRQLHDLGCALRPHRRKSPPPRPGAAGRPHDRHRLAQGSSHAVELGDEVLVIVAPGGRSSPPGTTSSRSRSSSRSVIATSCGRCCGVASFRPARCNAAPLADHGQRCVPPLSGGLANGEASDGAAPGAPRGNAPEERPGRPRRASVLRRGGCLCPCQTGLLVFVAALSAATVQRAQRAAAPRWAGGGGLPHQPAPPVLFSGGRSAGTRAWREIGRPLVHQPPAALEQVRPRVGRLDLVLDHVRQRRLDDLARVVRLLRRPIPERRRIPVKSITHSDANRSPIPTQTDHPFRRKSILVGASDAGLAIMSPGSLGSCRRSGLSHGISLHVELGWTRQRALTSGMLDSGRRGRPVLFHVCR